MTLAFSTPGAALAHIMDEVWLRKRHAALHDVYRADATITGLLPDTSLTLTEFDEMCVQFALLVDVLEWQLIDEFGDGQSAHFARMRLKVRLNTTGQLGWFEMINTFHFGQDGVASAYMLLDSLTFLEGVGALPQGALFIALAGGELAA